MNTVAIHIRLYFANQQSQTIPAVTVIIIIIIIIIIIEAFVSLMRYLNSHFTYLHHHRPSRSVKVKKA